MFNNYDQGEIDYDEEDEEINGISLKIILGLRNEFRDEEENNRKEREKKKEIERETKEILNGYVDEINLSSVIFSYISDKKYDKVLTEFSEEVKYRRDTVKSVIVGNSYIIYTWSYLAIKKTENCVCYCNMFVYENDRLIDKNTKVW